MSRKRHARISVVRMCNGIAVAILIVTACVLQINFESRPGDPPQREVEQLRRQMVDAELIATAAVDEGIRPAQFSVAAHGPRELDPAHFPLPVKEGEAALREYLAQLEKGYDRLKSTASYTATLLLHERVKGELLDQQIMHLKLRHEPFSVYLKWLTGESGREALFVDGDYDNKLHVRLGGWRGRLMPALKLSPTGSLATEKCRYPITTIGLLELSRKLIDHRRNDLQERLPVNCRMLDNRLCDGRVCYRFELEYESPDDSEVYRRSVLHLDKQWCVPLQIQNYTWPPPDSNLGDDELDQATLIEHYFYSNLKLSAELSDTDFDRNNSDYSFVR